eukprot:4792467-Prymnesium_polylepis.1
MGVTDCTPRTRRAHVGDLATVGDPWRPSNRWRHSLRHRVHCSYSCEVDSLTCARKSAPGQAHAPRCAVE